MSAVLWSRLYRAGYGQRCDPLGTTLWTQCIICEFPREILETVENASAQREHTKDAMTNL